MRIVIKRRAENSLAKIAQWIADQYFIDTGEKWLDEFDLAIENIAKSNVKYAICKDESLAKYEYRCFTYRDKWIVAYKITASKLTVYRFILGSRLK